MKNWLLPGTISVLALLSVLILKSIAPQLAPYQAIYFALAGIIFYTISRFSFQQLQRLAWPLYVVMILLLIISLTYGLLTGNTGRWIPILSINAQPSQLAIPIVALVLSTIQTSFNRLPTLLTALGIILLPAVLILVEPDLGTTIVYLLSTSIILLMSDLSWRKIASLSAIALLTAIFSWFFVLRPYQKQRITSFIDGEEQSQDANYNARQAVIAAGSGQLFGRGLGEGVQSHLRFLPERQTDFIFASFAEEFGFTGSIVVIALYTTIISFVLYTATQTTNTGQRYYCASIATMTIIQAGVNIGMNIGLFPITGITLPFMSYGGSSVLSLAVCYGIVQAAAANVQPKAALHLS